MIVSEKKFFQLLIEIF